MVAGRVVFEGYRGIGVCRVGMRVSSRGETTRWVRLGIANRLQARETRGVKLVPRDTVLERVRRDNFGKDRHREKVGWRVSEMDGD